MPQDDEPGGHGGTGRRRAPQPGRTIATVIVASLVSLAVITGLGVVLLYDNWNGNIHRVSLGDRVKNRPAKEQVAGSLEPMNILVMGSDTRSGVDNGIDGESGGGVSDTTILFHLSANREFAYGISIPRDTAVMRPTCYEADGSEIPASTGYVKWNAAYAIGGPFCTVQQFEQLTGVRVDNYLVVDFNKFKDMVDALDGVEVCIPHDIDDPEHDVHLEAGTQELRGEEALDYFRVRYGISGGIDPNRTRRQQAFIGSMITKALATDMLARPDRLIRFMNAATSSLQTDFRNGAQIADLALTAKGVGPGDIKFVTTPWVFSDKVSAGVEWAPEVEDLWRLVRRDRPLTAEFLEGALSAGDATGGTSRATDDPSTSSGTPSGTPSEGSSPVPGKSRGGLDAEGRAAVGLCA